MIKRIRNRIKRVKRKIQFKKDSQLYMKLNNEKQFDINPKTIRMLYEESDNAGKVDEHYFLQDIFMAREIIRANPIEHFDVGSRIEGFVSHLLTQRDNVTLIDIRKMPIEIEGLNYVQSDATRLENIKDKSINSLSSLHAIEHFGLGRYGDKIEPNAWREVLNSFERVLCYGGKLYLGVPIGNNNEVCYNAHRIFNPNTIISALPGLKLVRFAYIDKYKVHEVALEDIWKLKFERNYLCGLFIFEK